MSSDPHFLRVMDAVQHITDPEPPWDDILSGAAAMMGGDSATLIMLGRDDQLLLAQQRHVPEAAEREYVQHYFAQDIMTPHVLQARPGSWLDSSQIFHTGELDRSPYYVDYMRKHGMRQMAPLALHNAEYWCGLTIQYGAAANLQDRLGGEAAHTFASAFRTALSWRASRSKMLFRTVAAAFSSVGEAVLLSTAYGTIRECSPGAGQLLAARNDLSIASGRLTHRDPRMTGRLEQAHARTMHGIGTAPIKVPRTGSFPALCLDFGQADPGLGLVGRDAKVWVRIRVDEPKLPSTEELSAAFGLTFAESNVLSALMQGETSKSYALARGVTINTIRSQIAMLMGKMGCSRQVDLVRKALSVNDGATHIER